MDYPDMAADQDRIDGHMQVYLGYRHFAAETRLVDVNRDRVKSAPLSGLETLIGGVLIEF